MIQVGDKLLCVITVFETKYIPGIQKGKMYVANSIAECCGMIGIDIGQNLKEPCKSSCFKCGKRHNGIDAPYYLSTAFRKIEPAYKVIEIHSEILQEAREIIRTKETIAQ